MGWVRVTDDLSHPDFGKAFRCVCRKEEDAERRKGYLLSIDGLRPNERRFRFEDLRVSPHNRDAILAVQSALTARRGIVTLMGPPGTGKSTLLFCAINAARGLNIPSVYLNFSGLLDHLRSAYEPKRAEAMSQDARWELLVTADVLAIDELDDFNETPWALERFTRLIDERWRSLADKVTLLASNKPLNHFPAKVASRLGDGRASAVTLAGRDLRPLQDWKRGEWAG